MLPRANRVITGDEYRAVVRRGRRSSSAIAVYYRLPSAGAGPARYGFIVSRAVGVAVVRNRLRRRLRAICAELAAAGAAAEDVVVRVLPGAAKVSWVDLRADVRRAIAQPGVIR